MSNDFKDVINSMNKIELNKLEKDTINKIQKRIIALKNNERVKLEEKTKNEKMLLKQLEELKSQKKEIKKDKEEKIFKNHNIIQNKLSINKSNTLISNSVSFTTTNTKQPRINSAYKSINRKYLLTHNEDKKSYKTIKTFIDRPNSDSIYTSPSRYISTADNYPSSKKKFYFSRDKIINNKNAKKNINLIQKLKQSQTDRPNNNQKSQKKKKNVFKYSHRYIPRYNYNDYYFNKKFKKKYNFLENQFDKEIEFQKQLLKTKFYKDYSLKPEPFNYRDLEKKVEEFYYTTYEKELMNVKEK